MQAYTHLVFGALCRHQSNAHFKGRVAVATAFFVAAVSHPFLDIASQLTYHAWGGQAMHQPAWVTYHVCAYLYALAVGALFRRDWLMMLASMWPDLDWVMRPLHVGWPEGLLHSLLWKVPPIGALQSFAESHLPDLRGYWVAGLPELCVSLLISFMLLKKARTHVPMPVAVPVSRR